MNEVAEAHRVGLSPPQFDFVACPEQYPALAGGYGSGKSHAGYSRLLGLKLRYPRNDVAYYLPTYDLMRRIGFPRLSEELTNRGIPFTLKTSEKVIELNNGDWGKIILRTMDQPHRIVGYEVADSVVDEIDILPTDKAEDVWRKVLARNRQKKNDGSLNTAGIVTTPEGFKFVYDRWKNKPRSSKYKLFRAPTWTNRRNLPRGYIEGLREDYPPNLIDAYIEGEFVNLTSGSVYPNFHRELNASKEEMISTEKEKETLHIGMDFNVGKMSAVVHVLRGDDPHAVREHTKILDTPAMIRVLKQAYPDHPISVYPDASGGNRDSNNASESDISLLRQANFSVRVNSRNPFVKDRILSMQTMFGNRRYRVRVDKCPNYVECLEKQAYDENGEPDKKHNMDHLPDAGGYFIVYRYPVLKRTAHVHTLEA